MEEKSRERIRQAIKKIKKRERRRGGGEKEERGAGERGRGRGKGRREAAYGTLGDVGTHLTLEPPINSPKPSPH